MQRTSGSGVPRPNQRASSAQHFIVGMRCDDRDSFPRGQLISSGSSVWLNRIVETTLAQLLQIGERCPVADEEFVGLPPIDGSLDPPGQFVT